MGTAHAKKQPTHHQSTANLSARRREKCSNPPRNPSRLQSNARNAAPPPPAAEVETSASTTNVLTDGNLLGLILRRIGCASCLVGAALTSKRWLGDASRVSFVPDFCESHKPRLLGVFVSSEGISGSEFIPLPDPCSPAVSAVLNNHAANNFSFADDIIPGPNVWDCRDGHVLLEFNPEGVAYRTPLRYPDNDGVHLLPPNPPTLTENPHAVLLAPNPGASALCYCLDVRHWENGNNHMVAALVSLVRPGKGSWDVHCIAKARLPNSPVKILQPTVLDGHKIYMETEAGFILGLDMPTERFFIVDLPVGVELDQYLGNLVHCRGDDNGLYLFHVDENNSLNVWHCRIMNGAAGGAGGNNGWVLKDTISLEETCGHVVEQGWAAVGGGGEDGEAGVMVLGAGDNAEFVFLELGWTGIVVYMHLNTREVKKVYQRDANDDHFITVRPFMLVKPPVYPPPPLAAP